MSSGLCPAAPRPWWRKVASRIVQCALVIGLCVLILAPGSAEVHPGEIDLFDSDDSWNDAHNFTTIDHGWPIVYMQCNDMFYHVPRWNSRLRNLWNLTEGVRRFYPWRLLVDLLVVGTITTTLVRFSWKRACRFCVTERWKFTLADLCVAVAILSGLCAFLTARGAFSSSSLTSDPNLSPIYRSIGPEWVNVLFPWSTIPYVSELEMNVSLPIPDVRAIGHVQSIIVNLVQSPDELPEPEQWQLSGFRSVRHVAVSGSGAVEDSWGFFWEECSKVPRLKSLCIRDAVIGPETASGIAALSQVECLILDFVNFDANQFPTHESLNSALQQILDMPSLRTLIIVNSQIVFEEGEYQPIEVNFRNSHLRTLLLDTILLPLSIESFVAMSELKELETLWISLHLEDLPNCVWGRLDKLKSLHVEVVCQGESSDAVAENLDSLLYPLQQIEDLRATIYGVPSPFSSTQLLPVLSSLKGLRTLHIECGREELLKADDVAELHHANPALKFVK